MSAQPTSRTAPPLEDVAWVRRLARGLAADAHQAEDLAQETWVIALERGGLARGRGWLSGVLRHVALKSRRGAQRRAQHEALAGRPEAVDPAADIVARAALCGDLAGSVMQLDEPYRSALLLRYLDELPPRAIARRLGVPVGTVTSRLARGRALLRAHLDARKGGREAWLPAVVALGGGGASTAGTGGGAILMGTMAKVAVAAALALTGLLGVRQLMGPKADPPIEVAAAAESLERAEPKPGLLAEPPEERTRAAVAALEAQRAPAAGNVLLRGRVIDAACPELGISEGPAGSVKVHLKLSEKDSSSSPLGDLGYVGSTSPVDEVLAIDGTFSLELKDPGYRPLFFQAQCEGSPSHRYASADGVVQGSERTSSEVVVVRPPFGVLHGVVRDEAGGPLKGARVLATGLEKSEAMSDASGRFSLALEGDIKRVEASAPGYAPLVIPSPRPRPEGGYEDAELVLCAAGRLVVRVVDARERPLGEASVRLQLAPEELPPDNARDPWAGVREVAGQSDAGGIVEFADAWLGRKLRIHLKTVAGDVQYDKVLEGRLARTDEASGQALIIPPEGILEVLVVAPSEMLVRIAVRFPDGSPVPSPGYQIDDVASGATARRILASGTGDEAGNIEARVAREPSGGRIAIFVMDAAYNQFRPPEFHQAERIALDPGSALPSPEADGGVLAATVILRPAYSISGRLVDTDGQPVQQSNRVYAVPAGSGGPHPPTQLGREASTRSENGEFRITGLMEGSYDLYAAHVRAADVPAGTAGLDIVIPVRGGVRVRLALQGAQTGRPPKSMVVLVGSFQPSDGRTPPAHSPQSIRSAGLGAWPKDAPWNFTGASGSQGQAGWFRYSLSSTDDLEGHVVPDLGEGWYVFGVEPTDGKPTHFPAATDLVYLRPGEYEATFDLVPAAPLRGRITAEGPVGHLAVALVDAKGRPLQQHQESFMFGEMVTRIPLNAAGEFTFPVAPIGRRTLRVGTPAELDAGSFQREFEVEVTAEQAEPLVLRL